jgi:hypothetical protein
VRGWTAHDRGTVCRIESSSMARTNQQFVLRIILNRTAGMRAYRIEGVEVGARRVYDNRRISRLGIGGCDGRVGRYLTCGSYFVARRSTRAAGGGPGCPPCNLAQAGSWRAAWDQSEDDQHCGDETAGEGLTPGKCGYLFLSRPRNGNELFVVDRAQITATFRKRPYEQPLPRCPEPRSHHSPGDSIQTECAGAGDRQGKPADIPDDIRAHEVGVGMPARGEKEAEVEHEAADRGKSGKEPDENKCSDTELGENGQCANDLRVLRDTQEKEANGRSPAHPQYLSADVGTGSRPEEARVGELLNAGIDERYAQKDSERQDCQTRDRVHVREARPVKLDQGRR